MYVCCSYVYVRIYIYIYMWADNKLLAPGGTDVPY